VLTTLTKQALLAASIVVIAGLTGLGGNALAASQPASVETLFIAIVQGDWQSAEAIAAELDSKSEDKSLFTTFARATKLVANDDCASGGPLATNVVTRSPLFLPAYDLIAKCLVQAGEPTKAAAMFDEVAAHLNKGAERDQILARAQSLRPDMSPHYSLDVNVQPSTNANRGTDNTKAIGLAIPTLARTKSGVTVSAYVTVDKPIYVSKRLISSVSLRLGASYDTVFEQVMPSVRLSWNNRFLLSPQTSIGAVLAYEQVHKGTAFELASPSIAVDISHQMSPTLSLGVRGEIAYIHNSNSGKTGWTAKLDANGSYTILPNDRLNAALSIVHEDRSFDSQSFDQIGGSIEWEHAFESGLIGSLGGEASYRKYKSDAVGAVSISEKQVNIQAKATIGISHRNFMIGKFRPELAYTFTKQWSNDVFSDFTAHDVSVRAKAAF
jgi:hypothetical protein